MQHTTQISYEQSADTISESPLLPDVGVLALVPDIWGSPWMARHHVMTRLAKYFHVVWVDMPRHIREVWTNTHQTIPAISHTVDCRPGFSVYTPGRWDSLLYRPRSLARATAHLRYHNGVARLRSRGCKRIIVYMWRPLFAQALDFIRADISCYHLDDEYTFSRSDPPVPSQEAQLLRRVDHVFLHSPALMSKKGIYNPNTHQIPMGGDFASFATPQQQPSDLSEIPHPRIGYVGYVKGQLDFPLLTQLARRNRNYSFVFVGPYNDNLERYADEFQALKSQPNVYMLGERHVSDLAAYMQHMDVLLLTYRMDDYTKYISPMKLNEYLATGKPVVASPIRYLQDFDNVIRLANSEDEWCQALADSLATPANLPGQVQKRRCVARSQDWDRIVHRIARILCNSLGQSSCDVIDGCTPPEFMKDTAPYSYVPQLKPATTS